MCGSHSPWVIVLAGGDGRRLEGAVVQGRRLDRPKQFCRLGGPESLLRDTLRRAERITDPSRIVVVVRAEHRHWWTEELGELPGRNVLAEPDNRGTAVAILHALIHVLRHEGEPTLVLLPSDHAAAEEEVIVGSIRHAARTAAESGKQVVLLGLVPEYAETEYGWILPGGEPTDGARTVLRFVEKPVRELAEKLMAAGALWNSFICATSGSALLDLFGKCQPLVVRDLLKSHVLESSDQMERRARFRALPHLDFSRDILEVAMARLRVLAVPSCGWTDLGTPQRVDRWLRNRVGLSSRTLPGPIAAEST